MFILVELVSINIAWCQLGFPIPKSQSYLYKPMSHELRFSRTELCNRAVCSFWEIWARASQPYRKKERIGCAQISSEDGTWGPCPNPVSRWPEIQWEHSIAIWVPLVTGKAQEEIWVVGSIEAYFLSEPMVRLSRWFVAIVMGTASCMFVCLMYSIPFFSWWKKCTEVINHLVE